jgi:transcriptional regulator with XRE-family HTH domain
MDIKTIQENFSGRLTDLRQSLHYSRGQMADYFIVNRGTYRKYEPGLMMHGLLEFFKRELKKI